MTLVAAWVRHVATTRELVVASDSRLRFGREWDCCPKILPLPREDAVICFAGDTIYAYPVMLQLSHAVSMHQKTLSRATDLTDLSGHFLRVLNAMHGEIHDLPRNADDAPEVAFVLAGYSWKSNDFRIWRYYFMPVDRTFHAREASAHRKRTGGTKYFHFVGDETYAAAQKLYRLLGNRGRLRRGGLDMEPFEILVSMIRDPAYATIGGAPQIVKIYRHSNHMPYSVFWPNRASNVLTLWGRTLLPYERQRYLGLDPDTLEVVERPSDPDVPPRAG